MDTTALIVIDAQQEYFAPGGRIVLPDGPHAVTQIARALRWARAETVPVVHVVHESRRPGSPIFVPGSPALAVHPAAGPAPGEPVITKHLPGSFTGTTLEQTLRERGIEGVVLAGFMTQMCVDTTARQAAHLGFTVTVLADATAAMDVTGPDGQVIAHDQVHRTHLGSLSGFLAEIRRTADITG
ncbi:MAG: cysteine hydrolase [Candidatus Rokubacteria bacterium]|nr:cysteine hydrolase [Candidatus Rokubacteria bacterium]